MPAWRGLCGWYLQCPVWANACRSGLNSRDSWHCALQERLGDFLLQSKTSAWPGLPACGWRADSHHGVAAQPGPGLAQQLLPMWLALQRSIQRLLLQSVRHELTVICQRLCCRRYIRIEQEWRAAEGLLQPLLCRRACTKVDAFVLAEQTGKIPAGNDEASPAGGGRLTMCRSIFWAAEPGGGMLRITRPTGGEQARIACCGVHLQSGK